MKKKPISERLFLGKESKADLKTKMNYLAKEVGIPLYMSELYFSELTLLGKKNALSEKDKVFYERAKLIGLI